MYFVGYSEYAKSYKFYDLVARKVIMIRNVQFVENESWDGTVENNVNIVQTIDHDGMAEEVAR